MGGSAVRLTRQIPYTVACDLLLTGRHITATEAKEIGLIGHLVPDGQALTKALELAAIIERFVFRRFTSDRFVFGRLGHE